MGSTLPDTTEKRTPGWLLALGKEPPPQVIELRGETYRLHRIFKHDFFAYTARYAGADRHIVLKIGRKASFFGLPLGWIGRLHAWHESTVFQEVDDLEIVPAFTGRWGKHGMSHEFVEGHQLEKGEHAPDDFFATLRAGLDEIHRRGFAYVDLEKPENVLVGDDGKPYLFDFQISFRWPFAWGGQWAPVRWIRNTFQASDRYHVTKLQRRTRPDQMTEEEIEASRRRPGHLRWYGVLTRPFIHLRRRVLNRLDPVTKRGERGRVRPTGSSE